MKWDRRTFLQALLTWGIAQGSTIRPGYNSKFYRYHKALAESTNRKLALLIGINTYTKNLSLKGCLTDIERQKDLLVNRFGFHPTNILTLANEQATCQNIKNAFLEHLVNQAKTDDVVLVHFSGYGTQVKIPSNRISPVSDYSVLTQGIIPSEGNQLNKNITLTNNILQETLFLLGKLVDTEKLTMVFDTSYYSTGEINQGNLRVRSLPYQVSEANTDELVWQAELKSKIQNSGISNDYGTILSAAGIGQVATEIKGNDFSVGLFTYALTQYLWSVTPASRINIALNKATEEVLPIVGESQKPQQQNSTQKSLFAYYLLPINFQGAEALIDHAEDLDNIQIIFTGISADILRHYGLNSIFHTMSSNPLSFFQLHSRDGLKGKVHQISKGTRIYQPDLIGQLLQESVRCLPRTLGLTVALDSKLQRIERVDATSAFSVIDIVSDITNDEEKPVDCILGLLASFPFSTSSSESLNSSEKSKYGLFLPGGVQFPNTSGKTGEAIKSAVGRLRPNLEKLLAVKLLRLTVNESSSKLLCSINLEGLNPEPYPIDKRETNRNKIFTSQIGEIKDNPYEISNLQGLPKVARGTRLRYCLHNQGDKTLDFIIFGINSNGKVIAYIPAHEKEIELKAQGASFLKPGMKNAIPSTSSGLTWTTSSTRGWEQILLIASIYPFYNTWQALKKIPEFKIEKDQIIILDDPLSIAKALLEDLNTASIQINKRIMSNSDTYNLDVKAWSTLSFIYQII
ncbi:MAG: caspase family protein [Candidatus Atelocyanobacterium thalassa]|uniref:Caspase domain-containing protein n=1 Tax=Candidatus Atelocyanobacterium thalassa isolate SIO64986 TaxID=1527444 RepID=A0A086CFM4_9CHRO|nr:MAG: Caspase domain-containing protein [Candidatus Atelocyanobacterium thalassa isolate SIO64986]